MDQKQTLDYLKKRTTSQPFHLTFALLYIVITGAVAYLNGLTLCRNYLLVEGDTVFGLGLLLCLLLGLEWFERKRYQDEPPAGIALAILLVRMLIFEGMVMLDCTKTALFLYPMIPFGAYFAFGGRASTLLSLFYITLTIWKTNRLYSAWYIDSTVSTNLLAFAFVMLFTPLMAQVIRRNEQSQKRTETLLSDLRSSHLQLQAYAEQVGELAATEERNRLARDIHDSLGHHLTAVNIQLEKALAYQERDPAEATQAIRDAKQAAAQALQNVRHSVSALRTPEEHFSLSAALAHLINNFSDDEFNINFTITGDETGYSRHILMTLYRAAQEGLTNIRKHAHAHAVTLTLHLNETEAELQLRDDGQGFDTTSLDPTSVSPLSGFGLRGLRERLDIVRGKLALISSPQRGTQLTISIPKHLGGQMLRK
jgi:signal transduction histidine kinase